MKATGIVRRIDDLGRVFIPKEIRRTMRIREGDLLLTTLTPIDRFCWAIHSAVERYKRYCNNLLFILQYNHKIYYDWRKYHEKSSNNNFTNFFCSMLDCVWQYFIKQLKRRTNS